MSLIPVDDAILSDDNKVFYSDSETLGIYSFDTNTFYGLDLEEDIPKLYSAKIKL